MLFYINPLLYLPRITPFGGDIITPTSQMVILRLREVAGWVGYTTKTTGFKPNLAFNRWAALQLPAGPVHGVKRSLLARSLPGDLSQPLPVQESLGNPQTHGRGRA